MKASSVWPLAILLLISSSRYTIGSEFKTVEKPKNVLVLNSYHLGYEWTDSQINAILQSFEKADSTAHLNIENLGLKLFPIDDQPSRKILAIAEEYQDYKIDLAITGMINPWPPGGEMCRSRKS